MKALTVKQPWAWAIVHGGKNVENRTQAFTYRGLLAIHAGKASDEDAYLDERVQRAIADYTTVTTLSRRVVRERTFEPPVHGAVIGVVELIGAHHAYVPNRCCPPWGDDDRVHLELANPRALAEPIPARGALGIWTLPDDVAAAVRRQLDGGA